LIWTLDKKILGCGVFSIERPDNAFALAPDRN